MIPKQILLDLDGPIVDCVGDVLERYGVDRTNQETEITDYGALQRFLADPCRTPGGEDPWKAIGEDRGFWRSMTPQPWAYKLVGVCAERAPTIVCTKTLPYGECAAGKLDWCLQRKLDCSIVSGCKSALASPRHILIDDAEHQVNAFNAAGGVAVLWPMSWNRKGSVYRYGLERALREVSEAVYGG